MKRLSMILALLLCAALVLSGCGEKLTWDKKDARTGVVRILTSHQPLGDKQATRSAGTVTGSGFGVGTPGEATDIFVTNRHVVTDENTGKLKEYVYILLEDDAWGKTFVAEKFNSDGTVDGHSEVHYNEEHLVECEVLYPREGDPEFPDVAVIRAKRVVTERVALPLRSGWTVEQFDAVYSIGFPGSTDELLSDENWDAGYKEYTYPASISSMTVKDGVISRTLEMPELNYTTLFLHSAQTNHGNSGGPLVDEKGYVVGINTYGFPYTAQTTSGQTVNTGVPENYAALYVDYAMQKLDALGIAYRMDFPTDWALIGAVTAAAVLLLALALLLIRKKISSIPYYLVGQKGAYAGKRIHVRKTMTLGRDKSRCSLAFPGNAAAISNLHCMLEMKNGILYLQDCRSTNGTYLNGQRLKPDTPTVLRHGDSFFLGSPEQSFQLVLVRGRKGGKQAKAQQVASKAT